MRTSFVKLQVKLSDVHAYGCKLLCTEDVHHKVY